MVQRNHSDLPLNITSPPPGLKALSDGVFLDVVFLPLSPPGDLIDMAAQLSNQRLMCVLEACHLGGASTELVLSRTFRLNH
ncbi:hypothetical protein NQZ68_032793 [Dissostichus eleginoides]|nr:hypothetical protein NQZ68_032793 [Dissostichus eleginoides]